MLKKVVIKFLFLLAILCALNVIYTFTFYRSDLEENCKEVLDIKKNQANSDIFYFGESSDMTYSESDSIKNSISEMCNLFFPRLKIKTVNKYGTHSGIYKQWLKQFDATKPFPKAVVVTLNLRSFGAGWINSDLEPSLQQSLVFTYPLPNLVNRFLISLQAFDNRTKVERNRDIKKEWAKKILRLPYPFKYQTTAEWDESLGSIRYMNADGSRNFAKNELPCHYVKAYAFNIDADNPRVKDFDEIVGFCQTNNVQLYLNLMAENIHYADSLVGKELVFLMRENRDFLKQRYAVKNCKIIDNLEAVNENYFLEKNWTTEHYNYKGRLIIAQNLALALKEQFKHEYTKAY